MYYYAIKNAIVLNCTILRRSKKAVLESHHVDFNPNTTLKRLFPLDDANNKRKPIKDF